MTLAFLGIPGAGKSTLARSLSALTGATALLEPEEHAWPDFVRTTHPNGAFTRLCWFRSQRVPLYYEAEQLRLAGQTAILDSYYDKWCIGWLGCPGLEWLIAQDDPYMPIAKAMASVDSKLLPPADAVVVLEIDEELWRNQLVTRGRTIDQHDPFLHSHHSQSHFIATATERGPADGTRIIHYRRMPIPPEDEAVQLLQLLEENDLHFNRPT